MDLPKSYPTCSLIMAKMIASVAEALNSENSPGEPGEPKLYREGILYFLSKECKEEDLNRLKATVDNALKLY